MKKTTKVIFTLIASVFLLSTAVLAHPPFLHGRDSTERNPEQMADMMTVKMKYGLDLNAEQEAKVKALNLKYAKQHQEYLEANKKQIEAFENGIKKIEEEKDKELAAILKPEQLAKYNAKKEERAKHHKGKGRHGKYHRK